MIYLDHAANTKVDKEVLDKYYDTALNYYGNPNGNHAFAKKSQKLIEECYLNGIVLEEDYKNDKTKKEFEEFKPYTKEKFYATFRL